MKENTTISNNFSLLFESLDNVADVKLVANTLMKELKAAHDLRVKKLKASSAELKAEVSITTEAPVAKAKKATPAKAKVEKEPKAEVKKEPKADKKAAKKEVKKVADNSDIYDEDGCMTKIDLKEVAKLNLRFEVYSERSCALFGDTKPLRKILHKEYRGGFNDNLRGEVGWVFRKKDAERLAADLNLEIKEVTA